MKLESSSKDIFGQAVENFHTSKDQTPIRVHHTDFFDDEIPVEYLFRSYAEMPKLEQLALELCKGNVLDVGCCSGSHSLALKTKGHSILPIDISYRSIDTCHKRGLKSAKCIDFYDLQSVKFDTILMLMNGIGIAKTVQNLPDFFQHLKSLMHIESQVLLDSSDLKFLYEDEVFDEDSYYGEMVYQISYKNAISELFTWLYLDFELLKSKAHQEGLHCELIYEDGHYAFLAQLRLN